MEQKAIREFLERTFSLEGRTAVVTGAAGGIGSKIAEALACAGADIALCDINMENLGKTGETIREKGGNAKPFVVDVTDTDSVSSGVREIIKEYGHIDILVNCAGINRREGLMDVSEETYDRIMDINLKGVFRVSRAVAPYMKEQNKGSIINIGSHNTGSILGGCSVYIRANCVSPGHIRTELTVPTWQSPEKSKYLLDRIALARPGHPEDIAGVCVFLASDASGYITGDEIRIDGGCICGGQPWPYETKF